MPNLWLWTAWPGPHMAPERVVVKVAFAFARGAANDAATSIRMPKGYSSSSLASFREGTAKRINSSSNLIANSKLCHFPFAHDPASRLFQRLEFAIRLELELMRLAVPSLKKASDEEEYPSRHSNAGCRVVRSTSCEANATFTTTLSGPMRSRPRCPQPQVWHL